MKTWILSLISVLSLNAHAGTCESLVSQLSSLKDEFQALRFENDADQDRGYDREDDAIAPVHDFDAIAKRDACRPRAWKAFVDLAQAQSPFDGESRAAEVIAKRLAADKSLEKTYQDSIREYPDRCRSQNLSAMVQLHLCIDHQHRPYERCIGENKFNFVKCLHGGTKP